jgi:hypothetical protein
MYSKEPIRNLLIEINISYQLYTNNEKIKKYNKYHYNQNIQIFNYNIKNNQKHITMIIIYNIENMLLKQLLKTKLKLNNKKCKTISLITM